MLLRNLDVDKGECNGTRMRVVRLGELLIECELLTGERRGLRVLLPRIKMVARDTMLPQEMIRTQFPIRLAFAITINKAQGQTLSRVGVYLKRPCFAHGQLYVAFSRVRRPENLCVYIEDGATQGAFGTRLGKRFTKNVVYHSVLGDRPPVAVDGAAPVPPPRLAVPVRRDDNAGQRAPTTDGSMSDDRDDVLERLDVSQILRDLVPRDGVADVRDGPDGRLPFDPYVDEAGIDIPGPFVPYRYRDELEARVSVMDRPGTTGMALRDGRPRSNHSSDSESESD